MKNTEYKYIEVKNKDRKPNVELSGIDFVYGIPRYNPVHLLRCLPTKFY